MKLHTARSIIQAHRPPEFPQGDFPKAKAVLRKAHKQERRNKRKRTR